MKLSLILIIPVLGFFLSTQSALAQTKAANADFVSLFSTSEETEVACYRIPALVTAPNGDLIAAIDERVPSCGDLKWNNDINIVIRRSSDNGQTWTAIERVIDYPLGMSASDPSIIVDQVTSEIILFYNYMDLENEKDVYYLKMVKSKDNGRTWSEPIDITSQITKSDWHTDFKFITSGRGFQTKEGKLIHTLVNLDKGLHLFSSDDHGTSWNLIDTPIVPADESKVIELSDGTWMINSRVNNFGYRYVHTSIDQGKTWQSLVDSMLIDPGNNASLLKYVPSQGNQDTEILLFSNTKSSEQRQNLTLRISVDRGNTWSDGIVIYPGSAAYSSMTLLSNGNIGLFFEKDGYQDNVFVSIDVNSLMGEAKRD